MVWSPLVAAQPDHLEQAAGAELGVLGKGLVDEGQERIGQRRPDGVASELDAGTQQDPADGGVVDAELAGDGTDAPFFGMEQAKDRRHLVGGDHGGSLCTGKRGRRGNTILRSGPLPPPSFSSRSSERSNILPQPPQLTATPDESLVPVPAVSNVPIHAGVADSASMAWGPPLAEP